MGVLLSDLVDQLETDVPSASGVPTASQYERAVKDAVGDLGRRAPLRKIATINVVSGTASYALPDDFVRLIALATLSSSSGVLVSSAGLVPISSSFSEQHTIAGRMIAFRPTPGYTLERELWYAATYVLDDDDIYQDLTEDVAQIAMLKARALALHLQANKAAPLSTRKKADDVEKDATKVADALRAEAKDWEGQYLAAVQTLVGAVGMRG